MKKICLLGGGHGTSRLISGFKDKDVELDIILTSSDNGGHTGEILKEFDTPALGDLRMVLESVLDVPLLDFFKYRFDTLHSKNNVSLGNLMLLSLVLESGSVEGMLEKINKFVNPKYCFHLANNEYTELIGIDRDGTKINGEDNIGKCKNIKDIYFEKEGLIEDDVINAIMNADSIVLSFGSFFTSLGAIICSNKIKEALKNTKAKIIYIPNLVNQIETKDFILEDYVDFLENKLERKLDNVLISNTKIKRRVIKRYLKEDKKVVISKEKRENYEYYSLLEKNKDLLRHDVDYLAKIIVEK